MTTTKTTSALERLRHRFIQDVNFGGHRDSVRFTRDEMNEIIAAFEDEQRQRDERDAKIREAFAPLMERDRCLVDSSHSAWIAATRQALALLDGEKR